MNPYLKITLLSVLAAVFTTVAVICLRGSIDSAVEGTFSHPRVGAPTADDILRTRAAESRSDVLMVSAIVSGAAAAVFGIWAFVALIRMFPPGTSLDTDSHEGGADEEASDG